MSGDQYAYHEQTQPSQDGNVGLIALGLAGVMIVVMFSVTCWRYRSLVAQAKQHGLVSLSNSNNNSSINTGTEPDIAPTPDSSKRRQLTVTKHNEFIKNLITGQLSKRNRIGSEEDSGSIVSPRVRNDTGDNEGISSGDNDVFIVQEVRIPKTIAEESTRLCSDD